ncbi:hypothetical protein LGQ03_15210 [Loktanella sp. TSTF-M6]|uniref:Flp pilus assembly protein, pilin Flp n=1 Tax=Loktanella gaetbuli TaxID=2881335 RepID=A0ABS8BY16_9RHOB|nr:MULTISPECIES: hypothetical protein [Loktanella]MCB5200589.1 hypothetical protein [Loktanella gaetbuli]
MRKFIDVAARILRDDRGVTSLEAVLILGVVSVPLVTFLALAGTKFIVWMRSQAPNIFDEAETFTF